MFSAAKLNLYLHVTGKRQDGYHFLDSLMTFTDLQDNIEIKESKVTNLKITGDFADKVSATHNIVLKAVNMLQEKFHIKNQVDINLEKNIPVGAGLGGGSGDAATVLLALNNLWNLNLSLYELQVVGIKLGADVPFCLSRNAAFVSGIGEKIESMSFNKALYAVLVKPERNLSTKEVFSEFSDEFSNVVSKPKEFSNSDNLIDFLLDKKNDLEKPAIKLLPEIADILSAIQKQKNCLISRMSGSGSTCFGLFFDDESSKSAESILSLENSGWWVRKTKILFSI